MAQRDPASLRRLKGFSVMREGYGVMEWPGPIDVTGMRLDEILVIGRGACLHVAVHLYVCL
jgi:hypothetical protein